MIHVEQSRLPALEDDQLASRQGALNGGVGIPDIWPQASRGLQELAQPGLRGDCRNAVEGSEQAVLLTHGLLVLGPEQLLVQQVDGANAVAGPLVRIGGSDAIAGGAVAVVAAALLVEPVQLQMVGQNQVGPIADQQIAGIDSALGQLVELFEQLDRVHHHAGTDDTGDVGVQHAGGNEVEVVLAPAGHHGMPGVPPSVGANDQLGSLGQEVYELALAFIAPVAANDGDYRHAAAPSGKFSGMGAALRVWPALRGACQARRAYSTW